MPNKTIYIKPDEEITSVIDRMTKIAEEEVFLVIPKGSVIAQSLVNLKLLKREAGNLRKKITIVTDDAILGRLAKKSDFAVSDKIQDAYTDEEKIKEGQSKPAKQAGGKKVMVKVQSSEEDEEAEEGEPDGSLREDDAVLSDQLSEDEFEHFLKEEKKPAPLRMTDIVKSGFAPTGKLVSNKIKPFAAAQPEVKEPKDDHLNDEEPPESENENELDAQIHSFDEQQDDEFYEDAAKQPEAAGIREKFSSILKFPKFRKNAGEKIPMEARKDPEKSALPSFSMRIFSLFIVSAIIIAALVFYLVLPKAEISIAARRDKQTIDFKVSADKNSSDINLSLAKIPAQLVKLEERQSMDFPTTGEKQVNEKARGQITVYNAYSSSPQTLVETTRFLSPGGKIFRLVKTVTIPGAAIDEGRIIPSTLDVEVEADQPGPEYNIEAGDFTIPGFKGSPKYTGFYGKSKKTMEGGATGKMRILTQDDFNKAKDSIWSELKIKTEQSLLSQIPKDFKLLDGAVSLQIAEIKPSVEIGGKAENFTLTVKGVAKALVFSEPDLKRLVKDNYSEALGGNKEFVGEPALSYKEAKFDFEKGQISFKLEGQQDVIWKVDSTNIKNLIAGKTKDEAMEILLQQPGIKEGEISLWPFWISKIPPRADKIEVTVD